MKIEVNEGKIKISTSELVKFAEQGIYAQIKEREAHVCKGQRILNGEIKSKKTNSEIIDIIRKHNKKIEELDDLKSSLSYYIENCYKDIEFTK